ncbi:aldo/keto reductase [Chloroflexota bacterium]
MEYRRLGNSGLKVSALGLGGNGLGRFADEKTSVAIIERTLDMGINFIDTSDSYGTGQSEEYIGKGIKGKRSQVIIATKFGSVMGKGPNDRGGSRYHIMEAVDASLRRLQTDYIDLYQMHQPDPTTPIEETLRALDDLVRAGKVRYIGCSNFAGWQLCDALWTSKINNLHSFITVQSQYNMIKREIETELVPCCQTHNIGVIPWGPLLGGFLAGRYHKDEEPPADGKLLKPVRSYDKDSIFTDTNWDKLTKWEAFAKERGHTMIELAIAWLLAKPWLSTVIAGTIKIEQVSVNVTAAEWKLTAEEVMECNSGCNNFVS